MGSGKFLLITSDMRQILQIFFRLKFNLGYSTRILRAKLKNNELKNKIISSGKGQKSILGVKISLRTLSNFGFCLSLVISAIELPENLKQRI